MTTTYLPQNKIEPNDELWLKLKDFSIEEKSDLTKIKFTFLERLAKENNWSIAQHQKLSATGKDETE